MEIRHSAVSGTLDRGRSNSVSTTVTKPLVVSLSTSTSTEFQFVAGFTSTLMTYVQITFTVKTELTFTRSSPGASTLPKVGSFFIVIHRPINNDTRSSALLRDRATKDEIERCGTRMLARYSIELAVLRKVKSVSLVTNQVQVTYG